ncbi:integrin alpha-4 [Brienomyrus brachyistius]|uniref:integrin alpha-4 n=1 Tax=Brienomyrus brachyistius TaxID=42636 RepID=UPI0020B1E94D|nr:integrin alpha-4 [Brienomyrus brachyistius]XP_048835484.1 integrin alpha-4 [Brienomyrus brachyistius]
MKRNTAGKLLRRINVLNVTFIYLCCVPNYTDAYNLDVENYLSISGPNGSFFGYSVLLHENANGKWVIAGAPVAASKFHQQASNPGAIYKCKIPEKTCEQIYLDVSNCGKTCSPENDNQWLGVSLSRQQSSGNILACGHRWKNVFYTKKENHNKLPHGVCYKLDADLGKYVQLIPCYNDHQREFGKHYGSCQVGISNFMTEDLIVMGAPGSFYWTGSVLVYNMSSQIMSAYLDDDGVVLHGSYLGYSVGAGHFTNPSTIEIAAGAPQHEQTGKAYIFQVESNLLKILFEMTGHKLGSYFGASVCAVDLNSDGLSDLLVGAPMFSTIREEGRVYVYINQGAAKMKEAEFLLTGSDSYASRFGETITNLGDIDDDGFPDVAIGAPQEDELRGAIYIYNGRKSGISEAYSQKITGAVLGAHFSMFGQSVSGGVDIDNNGYPDVAVGSFLSDSAVVLRTRPVVIVEALVLLPPSINRSVPLCHDHGQLAVCSNITVCFRVQGKQIPGSIGMLYNLTADVKHREGFPNRFYFLENGTSNTTTGKVLARLNHVSCVTHTAYMRRDVRDIFTPIYFELKYELGKHSVPRERVTTLPYLKPVLQQRGKEHNQVRNKTEFARYCAWVNCSTNLQVSARLVLPHSHQNMPYFALGTGKTIMLNATLANLGDDAFLPMLHLRLPSNLYFIKVLEAEEKHVSCESLEDDKGTVDCSVGNSFLNSLAKLNISFLLDVNQSSSAGDLNITVTATRDNVENEDLLYDNTATVTLPLRYGVDLNIHGIVSQPSFVFGGPERIDCSTKKFNYTYKVISVGPSKAVGARVQIDIPKNLAPYNYRLLNIVDLQTSVGWCYIGDTDNGSALTCDVPQPNVLEELVFFFSKITKRQMYCMKPDHLCLQVVCELGDLDVGKDVTIQMEVELNPDVLQVSPGRHGIMQLESTAVAWPESPYAVFLTQTAFTKIVLEAHYSQRPREDLSMFIIASSLTAGLLILAVLIYVMWKAGFFRREYKEKQEAFERESWDFVQKSSEVY